MSLMWLIGRMTVIFLMSNNCAIETRNITLKPIFFNDKIRIVNT